MTPRGLEALREADVVLAEDTRSAQRLLAHFALSARLESLHDHNEEARVPGLLARLAQGERMALVSDAGAPLVSDPGFRLVRAAIAAGVAVSALPGANAALTALLLSGLPPQPFLFLGFLPPRAAARRAALARVRAAERAGLAATLLFYEAPHRLAATLADAATVLGPRAAAVARELTKRFEEVRRADLASLAADYAQAPPRGEITLVIGPPEESAAAPGAELDTRLRAALARHSLKDAAALVAGETGLPRRAVYARALALGAAQTSSAASSESSRSRPSGKARSTPPARSR